MRAEAVLSVAVSGSTGRSCLTRLRSDPPITLRPAASWLTPPVPGWDTARAAHVAVATSAAGPLGGDHLGLDVDVGPGADLVVTTVSASLLLPGASGRPSSMTTTIRVADGATLVWWPEPVIAARGCDHTATTRILLAEGARLAFREELIAGRHREPSGSVRQRVRVTIDERPLHHQELVIGRGAPGWSGAAVTAGHGAVGSALLVDPTEQGDQRPAGPRDPVEPRAAVAVLDLAGPGTLITVLAPDSHQLRTRLDAAVAAVLPEVRRTPEVV